MTKTELHRFLGLGAYNRWFVKDFAKISVHFYAETFSNRNIQCTAETYKDLEELEDKLTSPPVLDLPRFDQAFIFQTDASEYRWDPSQVGSRRMVV